MDDADSPHILAHYTSANGLLGIFESKSLWATRIQYLNDFSEFSHARELAFEAIRAHFEAVDLRKFDSTEDKTLNKEFRICSAIRDFLINLDPYLYITCFSENCDLLSQWRAYCAANLGYSISFETSRLKDLALEQGFVLKPCIYDLELQQKAMNSYIDSLVDDFMLKTPNDTDEYRFVHENIDPYVPSFLEIAPFLKNAAFQEEREWRLVSQVPSDESETRLRVGRSCLIPYRPFKFRLNAINHPIYSITIGPTSDQKLAGESIHYLLRDSPKPITWEHSKIPYRYI